MSQKNIRRQPTTEEEIVKCGENPLYYYNNYIRLDNEPILSQEEFDQKVKAFKEARDKQFTPEELEEIRQHQAKVMFENRPNHIDVVAEKVSNNVESIKNKILNKSKSSDKKKLVSRMKNRLAKKSRKNNRKK